MNYLLICPVGVIGGSEEYLTYHSIDPVTPGSIVSIPFGKRKVLGVVLQATSAPQFKTRAISKNENIKFPLLLLSLAQWMGSYYGVRVSFVLQTMLPTGLTKKRHSTLPTNPIPDREIIIPQLSTDQAVALKKIQHSDSVTHLLHGVTGSGKTRIYQELTRDALSHNKSVLILVPEISLTPQLAAEFKHLQKTVYVIHSGLTEAERHLLWLQISNEREPIIIIGPRSALFTPVESIGLIVIDECHEPSYIQDNQPKYSALRVARKLAGLHNAKLILGSATPLVSDYYTAIHTKTPIISLPKPISASNVAVEVVDMRQRETFGPHPIFSRTLIHALQQTLESGKQALLFHNRRGSARMVLCSNCGWVAECPNCYIPLKLHHDTHNLRCHICNISQPLPSVCPDCKNPDIIFNGFGSKRIEQEAQKLFPSASIARFDSDTPKQDQLVHRYQELYSGNISIIIGTQGLAKGLDLPNLDTVGIVQADTELFIPDFSSTERSFQLTAQVVGRVGRQGQKSRVIIQTFNPSHPSIEYGISQNYQSFYKTELKERELAHITPFTFMCHLVIGYATINAAQNAARLMKIQLNRSNPKVHVRGPSASFHEHKGRLFYQQLVLTSQTRSPLVEICRNLPPRWQFTLDPLNLL